MTASTETPNEPKAAARISDVPTDRLAHNFVGTLIEAKGLINRWDAMAVKLITMLREEFAEDMAEAVAAEREACAKVVETYGTNIHTPQIRELFAAAIRSRP